MTVCADYTQSAAPGEIPEPTWDLDLWQTAFHESGHAVGALVVGCPVYSATVVPTLRWGGCVWHAPHGQLTPDQLLLLTLAGPAAEAFCPGP